LKKLTYEHIREKILTPGQAANLFAEPYPGQHTMVFTNGCFDLLHRGHIYYLARARELGDPLVVGLNSDESVTRLKGPGRPLNNQQSRAEVLAALAVVDYVIIFEEDTPLQLINLLKPRILIKGGDYRREEIVGYNEVLSWGGAVKTIPLMEGYSTTSMIQKSR
jgi:rfaE bifunctional protein nucleotidyltransferase chain/domain